MRTTAPARPAGPLRPLPVPARVTPARLIGAGVAAVCAMSAGALLAVAPVAGASESGPVVVGPDPARPGQSVTVRAIGCPPEHADARSEAYSNAFQGHTVGLVSSGGQGETRGTATVRTDAPPGLYRVEVSCDAASQAPAMSATFQVAAEGAAGRSDEESSASPSPDPSTLGKGAQGGLGGGEISTGKRLAVAAGTAVVVAAVGGSVFAMRRRSGSH